MRKWKWFGVILILSMILVACSDDKDKSSNGDSEEAGDQGEMGELVPEFSLMTSLPETNQVNYEAAGDMAKEWEELGMVVDFEPIDFNVLVDRLYGDAQDFDMYTVGWSGRVDRIDPDMFIYAIFHSSNAMPGGNNTTGFENEEYDALADAQRTEMDENARRDIVFEAQEMLAEEAPMISLYARDLVHAYNNERFENFTVMAGEGIFNEWMPMEAKPTTDDKILRIASIQDLDTLNPLSANSVYEWRNLRVIYDKLVRLSPSAEPQPAAATDWEVVDDTTVDVTLREGMTFHDGKPVTVEDVKFSYDYMIEHEAGYFIAFLNPIESIETPDDSTIRFNLKEPYAPFVNVTLAQIPILPKHIWENVVEEEGLDHPGDFLNEEAIGSGPFVFEEWRRGEDLRTTKFDDFYVDVAIDGYTYDIFANDEAVMTALETGSADVNAEQFIPANIERAQELDHLTVELVPDIGYQYLSFNARRAPFHDPAFRQAIAHTINYDTIVDVYLDGYGQKGGSGLVIFPSNEYWHNPDVDRPDYDPARAKEILEEAGYTWDDDGRLRMPVGMSADD